MSRCRGVIFGDWCNGVRFGWLVEIVLMDRKSGLVIYTNPDRTVVGIE